jgi:hypothetical protein
VHGGTTCCCFQQQFLLPDHIGRIDIFHGRKTLDTGLVGFVIHADLGNVRHLLAALQEHTHPLR